MKHNQYLCAFCYAARDTLVANDVDQATRLAFNYNVRFRVVTIDGQLIDSQGTMSGGGSTKQCGTVSDSFNPSFSLQQIQSMQLDLDQSIQQLKTIRDLKSQPEINLETYSQHLNCLQLDFTKYQM
eukprot:TRINITY_DN3839_c0_g3_i2.p1 TRINITY_DN3839_c0_g3~~TRINITY_DN3839_c0_g3_i2.p1  ORF type:complete len:126 (-),score=57.42 TRINITY_DN3839_c0_g3_i2:527-904(-)